MGGLAFFGLLSILISLAIRWIILGRRLSLVAERQLFGFAFREIGPISPEQYYVYYRDHQIGNVRYRFGDLIAEFPKTGAYCIFEKDLKHQSGQMTDDEQGPWLRVIATRHRRCLREEPD